MATPAPRSEDLPVLGPDDLPCPECKLNGRGHQRLGNRRSKCDTCNWFYQQVQRKISRALKDKYSDEVRSSLRPKAEKDVFPLALERYDQQHPEAKAGKGGSGFMVEIDDDGLPLPGEAETFR